MIRNRIYDLFFLSILFAVIWGVSQLLAPFMGALLASLVCAIMFYPLYRALRRWFPHHHPTSIAFIADILVLIVFVTPMILLTWAVVQESSYLGPNIKQWSSTLEQWKRGDVTDSMPWMGHLQRVLGKVGVITPLQFQENTIERVAKGLEAISVWGRYAAQRAVFFMFDLLVMLFTLFFLFRDGDKWFGYIHDLIPLNRSDKEHLMARIHDTVIGVSRGWLLTGLIQGVTATLGYLAVGLEGAVLYGALTAFFGLVPGVGTIGIWIPIAIFLAAKGLYWRSVFILVWGAFIIVGLIDSVVRPYLIGKRVELPLFVLFFALLGGVAVWGPKGIIIGPILVGIAPVLLEIYRDRYLRKPEMKPKGSAVASHALAARMKLATLLLIGISVLIAVPLRADPPAASADDPPGESAYLIRHERILDRMQAERNLDNVHTHRAQEDFDKSSAEMSDDADQQVRDVQTLRSVESQVTTGKIQKTLAHQSYKDTLQKYGSDDPRSAAAQQNWVESQKAMSPLLQNRRALKKDIHQGGRLVHNDKTLLEIQKRTMDSQARYRAIDDRKILKEEKIIAGEKSAMTQNVRSSDPSDAK
jgi:predicted PurR-regulated permease PerM